MNSSEEYISDQNNNYNKNSNKKVRLFASYDMVWCTRGSGRQYDSLSGFGHIIGSESGKVICYTTRNRKCRLCDNGHSKDHPESDHKIFKRSDKNHTANGVKNVLHKIDKQKDPKKEMTSEVINYIHKCFTYAMSQNRGNSKMMATAIRNMPYHIYNHHNNCGDWCGYIKNKENYEHSTIIAGLKSLFLFDDMKEIFNKLVNNANTFAAGASTQANKSLNNILSKKAPKGTLYGTAESYDFRAVSAVGQKMWENNMYKMF